MVSTAKNADDAKANCVAEGGYLVSIGSQAENIFVFGLFGWIRIFLNSWFILQEKKAELSQDFFFVWVSRVKIKPSFLQRKKILQLSHSTCSLFVENCFFDWIIL